MIIYFQKIITWCFSPIGIIFGLIIFLFFKYSKKNLLIFFLIFILFSNYPLANFLLNKLENYNNLEQNINYKETYAVVILGGGKTKLNTKTKKEMYLIDFSGRYLSGINIFKKINAEKLVLSNLKLPWDNEFDNQIRDLENYIEYSNIDKSKLIILKNPLNTKDESKKLYDIIGKKKILLITSGYHSLRSKIIFENAGFDVLINKVAFMGNKNSQNHFLLYLPSITALKFNTLLFKEVLGILYYKFLD